MTILNWSYATSYRRLKYLKWKQRMVREQNFKKPNGGKNLSGGWEGGHLTSVELVNACSNNTMCSL